MSLLLYDVIADHKQSHVEKADISSLDSDVAGAKMTEVKDITAEVLLIQPGTFRV